MALEHNILKDVYIIDIDEKENVFAQFNEKKIMQTIDNLSVHACNKVAFDLSNKKYFNSKDLGGLIKINDMLIDEDIKVFIVAPSQTTKDLFELVGMSGLFKIVENQKELVSMLQSSG